MFFISNKLLETFVICGLKKKKDHTIHQIVQACFSKLEKYATPVATTTVKGGEETAICRQNFHDHGSVCF